MNIRHRLTCIFTYVMYFITCTLCGKIYFAETEIRDVDKDD